MYTIAILDSDESRISEIKEVLASGYSIITANDGEMGLSLVQGTRPDLVIANIQLNRKKGTEVLEDIRQDPAISCTLMFMLSDGAVDSEVSKAYALGANAVIDYPSQIKHLKSMVSGRLLWHKNKNKAKGHQELSNLIKSKHKFLAKVNSAIEQELSNVDMNMAMLASRIGVSTSTLQKKLKKLSNKSVSQYVREYRLAKASELIEAGHNNLALVAQTTGFRNQSYFSKSFRTFFGYPPSNLL